MGQQSIDGTVADIRLPYLACVGLSPVVKAWLSLVIACGIEGTMGDNGYLQLDLREWEFAAGRDKTGKEIAVDFNNDVALKNSMPKAVA